MDRVELVRLLVLNSIADDYENVDQVILREVADNLSKLGLVIERPEVVDALSRLVEDGLAKAYLLSAREPYSTELQGMPALDLVEEDFKTYFYVTQQGKDVLLSGRTVWPFDEDGNPL